MPQSERSTNWFNLFEGNRITGEFRLVLKDGELYLEVCPEDDWYSGSRQLTNALEELGIEWKQRGSADG